jgi:hypothetical protein
MKMPPPTQDEIEAAANAVFRTSRAQIQRATAKLFNNNTAPTEEALKEWQYLYLCRQALYQADHYDHGLKNLKWHYPALNRNRVEPIFSGGDYLQISARHQAECVRLEALYKQILYGKVTRQAEADKVLKKFWEKWGRASRQ